MNKEDILYVRRLVGIKNDVMNEYVDALVKEALDYNYYYDLAAEDVLRRMAPSLDRRR